MARVILTTPGEDIFVGGSNVEVNGTSTGGEVIQVAPNTAGDYVLDASFSAGGDTIVLPGNADDYSVRIEGSRYVLTNQDDGTTVSIPVSATGNTLQFDNGDTRTVAIVNGQLQIGGQVIAPNVDNDLDAGAGAVVLTAGVDIVSGEVFSAPRVFTPGGTDQVNSLNDDDELTGTGARNVLNFTYVNDADTGDNNINPTMTNVQVVNVDVRTDVDSTLDLQDSAGVEEINVEGVDDFVDFVVDNIQAQTDSDPTTWDLSVSDSQADTGTVSFLFDEDALDGDADVANLTLDDAELLEVAIDDEGGDSGLGVETLNIESAGDNEVGTLFVEDVRVVNIDGAGDLTLGDREEVLRAGGTAVEAFTYSGGLGGVEGSLTTVDASGMTGDLDIVINDEISATSDETSGADVNLQVLGGSGNDTFRLVGVPDSEEDVIDGGAGDDVLYTASSVTNGSIDDIELLDIRGDEETISVDGDVFDALETIWIRNESNDNAVLTTPESVDGLVTADLNDLSAAAAGDINLQHGVTLSNGLDNLVVDVDLKSTTGTNTVGISWVDQLDEEDRGINNDPRFNFTVVTEAGVENLTLNDDDGESNSVLHTAPARITGTLTLTGGDDGEFLSLDVIDPDLTGPIDPATAENIYGRDTSGGDADAGTNDNVGETSGHVFQAGDDAATRYIAATIDGTAHVGDVQIRVGEATQDIVMGTGDDTVIFDARLNSTAGLTVADDVDGGEGNDTLALEGNRVVTIGGSEWLNVENFETILLVGNDDLGLVLSDDGDIFDNEFGENYYNIRLTEELLEQNGEVGAGGIRTIHIRNDNDLAGPNDVGGNTGATIDATPLNSGLSFSYDGAEDANATDDRFIMSDINLSGRAVIDGGEDDTGGDAANEDILEVRATQAGLGAQVTADDLENIQNVGIFEFVNNTANDVTHFLELTNALVDQLVNSTVTTGPEVLTIRVYDNPDLATAETTLILDLSNFTGGGDEVLAFEGNGTIEFVGAGFSNQAEAEAAGFDFSAFGGDVEFSDPGETLSQDFDSAAGNETFDFGADTAADSLTVDAVADRVDTVTNFGSEDSIFFQGVFDQDVDGVLDIVTGVAATPLDLDTTEAGYVDWDTNFAVGVADLTDVNAVAGELNSSFALLNDAAGKTSLFILEAGDDQGNAGWYQFTSDGVAGITGAELQLLGTLTETADGAIIDSTNFSFA